MGILSFFVGIGVFMLILMIAIPILLLTFWTWMIVDCATRKFKSDTDRIFWILIILFANVIGAFIYYFVIKLRK